MDWNKQPPQVLHSEPRPENYRQMIRDAAHNIHMRKQAASLLECYASHANTFRPAAKVITRQTGIAKQDISKVRKRLVEYGLIAYRDYPGFVYIEWRRIRAFAMLQEPLKLRPFADYRFFPVIISDGQYRPLSKTIGQLGKRYRIINPRPLSKEESRFYSVLENMTEDEYFELVEGIRQDEFQSMPKPDREKTALHNKLDEERFFLPEAEKTALHNNWVTDSTSWPQIITYQLPF